MNTFLQLTIPAGEAKMTPPLGVILGQHQLPGAKICLDFNKQTASILPGVPIRVQIKKLPQNNFDLKIKTPPVSALILQQLDFDFSIKIESLFDIFKIYRSFSEFSLISDKTLASLIFSTLQSTRCRNINF